MSRLIVVGFPDAIATRVISHLPRGIAVLGPRRLSRLVEVGLFDHIAARVIGLGDRGVAVLQPCRLSGFVKHVGLDTIAACKRPLTGGAGTYACTYTSIR